MKNSEYQIGESSHSKVDPVNYDLEQAEEPYVVILDGSILYHCVKNRLSCNDIKDLFKGWFVELYVTDCTLNELRIFSQRYPGNDNKNTLQYAKEFTVWRCHHTRKNYSSENCIRALLGIDNYNEYYVAVKTPSFLRSLRLNNRNLVISASISQFYFALPLKTEPKSENEEIFVRKRTRNLHYQRLHTRFKLHGFVETVVKGDGNCQFRALSHQFYHTQELHRQVREEIVVQLYTHPELYKLPQSPEDRQIYLENLLIDGTWGNGVTLQAAADLYCVRIFVVQSSRVDSFFEIIPNTAFHSLRYDRVIHLSYLENEHYNSLYPEMRERRIKWGNSVNSHIWF